MSVAIEGWAVAFTHPREEDRAVRQAERRGFKAYCPRINYKKRRPSGVLYTRVEPLFPRYIFVQVVDSWYELFSVEGIVRLIMNANARPALLANSFIRDIQRNCGTDGYYKTTKFARGQAVRINKSGPFAGRVAIYDGQTGLDRVGVLLQFLNRTIRVRLREDDLSAA